MLCSNNLIPRDYCSFHRIFHIIIPQNACSLSNKIYKANRLVCRVGRAMQDQLMASSPLGDSVSCDYQHDNENGRWIFCQCVTIALLSSGHCGFNHSHTRLIPAISTAFFLLRSPNICLNIGSDNKIDSSNI